MVITRNNEVVGITFYTKENWLKKEEDFKV